MYISPKLFQDRVVLQISNNKGFLILFCFNNKVIQYNKIFYVNNNQNLGYVSISYLPSNWNITFFPVISNFCILATFMLIFQNSKSELRIYKLY